ncbi:Diuretic hormone receptor isoform 2 [Schistosoma japonicum]|uniref:Diuretic hormone receptor isoform 2 n=1 Tax=Schistosoma japonicum TaxID=6182 RepID=A0A4Z2DIH0_SCHJA|nr:Diuretic hormone receptor isoform 2 [Schistosoma japonicum]
MYMCAVLIFFMNKGMHLIRETTTDDSFRECFLNGSWAEFADYSACSIIYPLTDEFFIFLCFLIGYIISTISVISGIFILQYFRSLRCVRNNIHTHLMIAILLRASSWICLAILNTTTLLYSQAVNNILTCILAFGMIAVYSWMLIEGVHLMNILFLTFIVRQLRFTCYSIIGWGIPAVLTSSWAITKSIKLGHSNLWTEPTTSDPEGILVVTSILITLAVNFFIMFITLFMLLTKLHGKASGIVDTGKIRGSRISKKQHHLHGERVNKSHTELQITDEDDSKQHHNQTVNNSAVSNNNNNVNSTDKVINVDIQTTAPIAALTTSTTMARTPKDIVTTGKVKSLKSSLKSPSNSRFPTATSTTQSVRPNISETHLIKSHITIIMKDKCTVNKSGRHLSAYKHSPSIRQWKTSKHSQRKSTDNNSLSSTTISLNEIRKAIKAIIFLMPLLGFSQLIFLIPYSKASGRIFDYINAIMLSTQGFWVTLIYCYLNSEVQRVLRTRIRVLCPTLKNQPSERIRQKRSFNTNATMISNNNNNDTVYQRYLE